VVTVSRYTLAMMGLSHSLLFLLLTIISTLQSAIISNGRLMHDVGDEYGYMRYVCIYCTKACIIVTLWLASIHVFYIVSYICVHFFSLVLPDTYWLFKSNQYNSSLQDKQCISVQSVDLGHVIKDAA